MDYIKIVTGKDLLDSGIKHFEVINGSWIGKVEIRNCNPFVYIYNYHGDLINSKQIKNSTILNLIIKSIDQEVIKMDLETMKRLEELETEVKNIKKADEQLKAYDEMRKNVDIVAAQAKAMRDAFEEAGFTFEEMIEMIKLSNGGKLK